MNKHDKDYNNDKAEDLSSELNNDNNIDDSHAKLNDQNTDNFSSDELPVPNFDETQEFDKVNDDYANESEAKMNDDLSENIQENSSEKDLIGEPESVTVAPSEVPLSRSELRKQQKKNKRKKKAWAIGASVAILAAVGGYFGYQYYYEQSNTDVPKAMSHISYDQNVKNVCKDFVNADLKCNVKWEISDDAERGMLLNQSVKPNQKVNKGTNVTLTYANGPSTAEFPNLTNIDVEEAKEILYNVNIEVDEIKEVDGNGFEKGRVVSTSIKPGTEVKNGDSVTIEVSNGKIKLPDWSGKTREYVEADAEKLGIKVKFTEEESEKASGIVISQTPKAGESNVSTEVNVVVSKSFKEKQIKVPDVIGKKAEEAQTELATAGFRQIKTVKVKNDEVTESQVTQVVPGVGQKASSEENIVIIVSEPIKK